MNNQMIEAFRKEKDRMHHIDGHMTPSTTEIVQQQLDIAEQRHETEIKQLVEIHKREMS